MIQLKGISKIYYMGDLKVIALDSVSLTIESGEMVAIVGPSGSGKSTMMNIIGCLDTPTEGNYILDDQEITACSEKELAWVRNCKMGLWCG